MNRLPFNRTFLSLVLIVALVPLLSGYWWMDVARSSPVDYLSLPGIFLVGITGFVFVRLVWVRAFRLIVLAVVLAAIAAAAWQSIASLNLFVVIAGSIVLGLIVEAANQNRSLLEVLRRENVPVSRLLIRAFWLWLPMTLLIALGLAINSALIDVSKQMVYSITPIDRYCVLAPGENNLSTDSAEVFPCTGLGDTATYCEDDSGDCDIRPASAKATINEYVELAFEVRTLILLEMIEEFAEDVLKDIERPRDPEVIDERVYPFLTDFRSELEVPSVLQFSRTESLAEELIARDETLRSIKELTPGRWANSALQTLVSARTSELKKEAATRTEGDVSLQVRDLRAKLSKISSRVTTRIPAGELYTMVERGIGDAPEIISMYLESLDIAVLKVMHDLEAGSKTVINQWIDEWSVDDNVLIEALNLPELCTTERVNEEVTSAHSQQPASSNGPLFRCPSIQQQGAVQIREIEFSQSVENSIDAYAASQRKRIDAASRRIVYEADQSAKSSRQLAADILGLIDPQIDLGRQECSLKFYPPANCVANALKEEAEEAYSTTIGGLKTDATTTVNQVSESGRFQTERKVLAAREEALKSVDDTARILKDSVGGFFRYEKFVAAFLFFFLGLAAVKSFLYVLATEVFSEQEPLAIAIGDDKRPQGIVRIESPLRIPPDFSKALITRSEGDNQQKSALFFHQPFTAILSRLRHSSWIRLNKGGHTTKSEDMVFERGEGENFAEWVMEPGEQVVFGFKSFFGMSENVRLKTVFSLHLSTILLGRYLFHMAECNQEDGKGLLILVTNRSEAPDDTEIRAATLDRIIAWNAHTRFKVFSKRNLKSVYIDGYTVGPVRDGEAGSGLVLLGATNRSAGVIGDISRFFRTFLSPI